MENQERKIVKTGRVGGHNSKHKSGKVSIAKELRHELAGVFRENIDKGAIKNKKIGQATIEKRKDVILGFFSDLYLLKFKIKALKNLGQKHIKVVMLHLEAQGQSPSTIQNKLSVMRIFGEWIGKPGLVLPAEAYGLRPESVKRTMVAQEDKSWDAKKIRVMDMLAEIEKEDQMVSGVLTLCFTFGLRIKEAVLLNLFKAEDSGMLMIVQGTKGGRARSVPIEHDWQRKAFERLKSNVNQKTGRFVTGDGVESCIRRVYYVMEKNELTLANLGVSAHGLRHQYFHERFHEKLGIQPPVKGGNLMGVDKQEFGDTTAMLMERAGHSRPTIGASYYGSRRIPGSGKDESEFDTKPSIDDSEISQE